MSTLVNADFHHRRLGVHKLLHSLNDLERVFAMDLLPGLKPLNHIIDKFLGHFISQPNPVIVIINPDRIDIQLLKRRWRVRDLDRFLKLDPPHQLLAVGEF